METIKLFIIHLICQTILACSHHKVANQIKLMTLDDSGYI
jgi:hypothetical protein